MKIKFINHASFIIEHRGISLLSDLWLDGEIFNKSWRLISPSQFRYEDFKNVDFVWFSHEHPDHFSPPDIRKIPPEQKKKIVALFQSTIDKRVANFCSTAGFKSVQELHKECCFRLADDFEVLCEPAIEGDSWICYKVGGLTILNTNDCAIRTVSEAFEIQKKIGGKVDILLSKFSYASWSGNPEDIILRKEIAQKKLNLLDLQVKVFKPNVTIPIASYFYFCHEENYYLNDHINSPEKVYSYLNGQGDTVPVILYPGDEYEYDLTYNSTNAINKYKVDYAKVLTHKDGAEKLEKTKIIPFENIKLAVHNYTSWLHSMRGSFTFFSAFIGEVAIYLFDYKKSIILSPETGLIELDIPYKDCDVAISTESLLFCLLFPYGSETVRIGARLRRPFNGDFAKFYNFFRLKMLIDRQEEVTADKFKKLIP